MLHFTCIDSTNICLVPATVLVTGILKISIPFEHTVLIYISKVLFSSLSIYH